MGSFSGREARSPSFLSPFPFLWVPWDSCEVSRVGQRGVSLVSSASFPSEASGMGSQRRIPGAVARTLRTRCGGCGDSLGAEGLGASPLAALALPRPPPRFPCSEVFEASHPLGLPGPPPPPSGLSHPSRLSAAPTPHPPAALRPLRTSAPPSRAVCAQRLQTLPWALLDPQRGQDSCRPPLGDGPRALKAESAGSFRD